MAVALLFPSEAEGERKENLSSGRFWRELGGASCSLIRKKMRSDEGEWGGESLGGAMPNGQLCVRGCAPLG